MVLILLLWGIVSLCLPASNPAIASSLPASAIPSPEEYLEQGMEAFQQGDFEKAVSHWTEAARFYEKAGKLNAQSEALAYMAQTYQSIGQYAEALKRFERALALAEKSGDRLQIASVLGSLGNLYIATGPVDIAYQSLTKGLGIARELGETGLAAVILNNLGNLFVSQKKQADALKAYQESVKFAQETDNRALAARALTNAARASQEIGQPAEAKALLDRSLDQMRGLSPSLDKAYGLINVGLAYELLHSHLPDDHDLLLQRAYEALNEAVTGAERIGDLRAASYAWGYLGKLYAAEHRYPEALHLTRKAIFATQRIHLPESLYRWYNSWDASGSMTIPSSY